MTNIAIEGVSQIRTNPVPSAYQPSLNNAYLSQLNSFQQEFASSQNSFGPNQQNTFPTQLNTTALVGQSLESVLPPSLAASFAGGNDLFEAQGVIGDVILYPIGLTKADAAIQQLYPTQLGETAGAAATYPIQNALASDFYNQTNVEVSRAPVQVTVAV